MTDEPDAYQQGVADAKFEAEVASRIAAYGADPNQLMDSISFRQAVDDLPDDGFDQHLDQLIATRLGLPEPTTSRPNIYALKSGALPASDDGHVDPDAWIRRQAGYPAW